MPYKYTTGRANVPGALSERDKMLSGKPYLAISDPQLVKERLRARPLIQKYNAYPWPTNEADNPDPDYFGPDDRRLVLAELFGIQLDDIKHKPIEIEPPFFCDYGTNIVFKGPFYSNFNCHILDCATVTFGSRVICGPNVHVYAGTHSTDVHERQKGLERAYPVSVGDDVWIGGGAIIVGPCNIGNGTTVAAGAVVRGDIPANVLVGGVPGRIIKHLTAKNNHDGSPARGDNDPSTGKAGGVKQASASQSTLGKTKVAPRSPGPKHARSTSTAAGTGNAQAGEDNEWGKPSSQQSEEAVDPATECFLANIPTSLGTSTLQSALSAYGEVQSLTLDRGRRLGFVRFDSALAAENAVEAGRGPNGLVVTVDGDTKEKMVVGIERRRMSDGNRTFNPDLITSTRCLIRKVPNTVDFEELKKSIVSKAGKLVEWIVQDFTSPDPQKPSTDKFISLEFEQLCSAREAVRLSQSVNGGVGGVEVPGADGLRVRIEARKQFSPHSTRPSYRGSHPSYHHPPRGSYGYRPPHAAGAYPHKPFNGSMTKWRPRRGAPGAGIGSGE